jgi:RNA polymerase sigma-70 factor (ECF subfamily)
MNSDDQIRHERVLRHAVLAGDDAAWRTIYDHHFNSLYAFVHFRTGWRVDWTEEAVQECWLTAVRRIRDFDPARGTFRSWLRGIAENVLRNQCRSRKRRAGAERSSLPDGRGLEEAEAKSEPAEEEGLVERIVLTLAGLPRGYQAVLKAKYEDGLPVAEIAASWGKTPKTIESLLARARAAFREAYSRLSEET